MAQQTEADDDDEQGREVQTPRPTVVPLSSVPVTPADSWPERLDVANMITRGEHGSEVLLGAAWMEPGQECNPWSFEDEDPQIDGMTFYGPTHETYFVLRGTLQLSWNGGSLEAGPDDAVYLAPGYRYALRCVGDEPAYFLWSMSPPPV
ncbi:MAG TPA: cupin domain-containing protein [Thermoleophilaceae bacterium]|nr:cupin domain-containing protein [Thermoleophilaceae bacterium]